MRNPNFDKVDIEGLGKFKVEGGDVILNLIGYLVLPELLDDRRVVVDTKYPIAFFVGYHKEERPYLGFRGNKEDLVGRFYSNYNELSEADKTIIESNRNNVGKKDIEGCLLTTLINSISECKTEINRLCKKWPQRNECLKMLWEIENNIDQLYILKTDFYERP